MGSVVKAIINARFGKRADRRSVMLTAEECWYLLDLLEANLEEDMLEVNNHMMMHSITEELSITIRRDQRA